MPASFKRPGYSSPASTGTNAQALWERSTHTAYEHRGRILADKSGMLHIVTTPSPVLWGLLESIALMAVMSLPTGLPVQFVRQ